MLAAKFILAAWLAALPPPDVGNLTATAILGWYAWHTASRTLPALVRNFREELAAMRDDGRAARETFRQALAEERAQRRADQAAVVDALHALARQSPTAFDSPLVSRPSSSKGR